jgi:hypothetical protein
LPDVTPEVSACDNTSKQADDNKREPIIIIFIIGIILLDALLQSIGKTSDGVAVFMGSYPVIFAIKVS